MLEKIFLRAPLAAFAKPCGHGARGAACGAAVFGCLFALGFAGGASTMIVAFESQHLEATSSLSMPASSPPLATRMDLEAMPSVAKPAGQPSARVVIEASRLPGPSARHGLQARVATKGVAIPRTVVAEAIQPLPDAYTSPLVVQSGDTLMQILLTNGIEAPDAHAAIEALKDVYDPRSLQTGQEVLISYEMSGGFLRLSELSLNFGSLQAIKVLRGDKGTFKSRKVDRPSRRVTVHNGSEIHDSVYLAASQAAVPHMITAKFIKLFSWDVDFQRDVRAGDTMEVLYEQVVVEDAKKNVIPGEILFARLGLNGRQVEAYRFEYSNGEGAYFDRTGRSLAKLLLRTPIDGGRLSSHFGMRTHPILGYSRMHKGIDFAAPQGTPIFAAGSGRIEVAGWSGSYGNYVRIMHNDVYGTAYAHMSRLADGIGPGVEVSQGEVIGYVGTTGSSTGSHLHYEVLRHGEQVDPLRVRQAVLDQLTGEQLDRFKREVARIDNLRDNTRPITRLAANFD